MRTCPDVGKAITFYRNATWKWQTLMKTPKTKASKARILASACDYAHHVAKLWTKRAFKARLKYKEHVRQWNWRAFPYWVQDLARCESSYNWWAEATSSDGEFYSAFNIGRSRYDAAAHLMGVRGWNEGPGIPSPWEQAQAVIGYVRINGDGFTGSCAGIARSSW